MRMFMLPLMLVCSLSSAAQNMPQELYDAMTGFDYGVLITASSRIMEKYSDRIRTILIDENNPAQLEITSDEESFELTIAI